MVIRMVMKVMKHVVMMIKMAILTMKTMQKGHENAFNKVEDDHHCYGNEHRHEGNAARLNDDVDRDIKDEDRCDKVGDNYHS